MSDGGRDGTRARVYAPREHRLPDSLKLTGSARLFDQAWWGIPLQRTEVATLASQWHRYTVKLSIESTPVLQRLDFHLLRRG